MSTPEGGSPEPGPTPGPDLGSGRGYPPPGYVYDREAKREGLAEEPWELWERFVKWTDATRLVVDLERTFHPFMARLEDLWPRTDVACAALLEELHPDVSWTAAGGWRVWDGRIHRRAVGLADMFTRELADGYVRALDAVERAIEMEADKEHAKSASGSPTTTTLAEADRVRKKWTRKLMPWTRYGERLNSHQGQEAVEAEFRKVAMLDDSEFDADPDVLVMGNGVISLEMVRHTGVVELQPARMERLVTLGTDVPWDPDAECPLFERYLAGSVPSETMRLYLQKSMGAMLLGRNWEKALINLIGVPDSGKTLFLNMMQAVWGDYACTVPIRAFLAKRDGDPGYEMHEMRGRRLVVSVEPGRGKSLDDSVVKQITGGDRVRSREPYGKFVSWQPQCMIVIASNNAMRIDTTDLAMKRRLRPITFPHSFVDSPDAPEGRRMDRGLEDKLMGELPGIAVWCLEGLLLYLRDGLLEPEEMTAKRDRMATEMETSLQFAEEKIELGELVRTRRADPDGPDIPLSKCMAVGTAHHWYVSWCDDRFMPPTSRQGRKTMSDVLAARYGGEAESDGKYYRFPGLAISSHL